MLNVTQTKDLSQKPKVGLSISKPKKGKSGLVNVNILLLKLFVV